MPCKRLFAALIAACLLFMSSCFEGDPTAPSSKPPVSSEPTTTVEPSSEEPSSEDPSSEDPSSEESSEQPTSSETSSQPVSSETSSKQTSSETSSDTSDDAPERSGKLSSEQLEAFANSAFVGNSVMDGFAAYNVVSTADCYTRTSLSVFNYDSRKFESGRAGKGKTLPDAIPADVCGKSYSEIFVLFGINETSYSLNKFAEAYGELIDMLHKAQPDATIYIFSIFPITKAKSDKNESGWTNSHIIEMNDRIQSVCDTHNAVYLDLHSRLKNEKGVLPAEDSSDGIHLKRKTYGYVAECVYEMVYA